MNRSLLLIIAVISTVIVHAASGFSTYRGVYAGDNAEAVITDSVCIMYFQQDSTMQAIIEIPSAGILHKTVFSPDGSVSFPSDIAPVAISRDNGTVTINGIRLIKVEDITVVPPYEMSLCKTASEVGRCLQEWRLGTDYGVIDSLPACEINTNRHMFVYMVTPNMVYIRAAAARNNDRGTLFWQNIRMMKNQNTGEYTMYIAPDNLSFVRSDLEMDNSKFQSNTCTFDSGGGIYWSLISYSPANILLNGCGDTYDVPRPDKESTLKEWIRYEPYTSVSGSPLFK